MDHSSGTPNYFWQSQFPLLTDSVQSIFKPTDTLCKTIRFSSDIFLISQDKSMVRWQFHQNTHKHEAKCCTINLPHNHCKLPRSWWRQCLPSKVQATLSVWPPAVPPPAFEATSAGRMLPSLQLVSACCASAMISMACCWSGCGDGGGWAWL